MNNIFSVSVDGAVWKCHDTIAQALAQAEEIVDGRRTYDPQSSTVRVEELAWRMGRWVCIVVRREWIAGAAPTAVR